MAIDLSKGFNAAYLMRIEPRLTETKADMLAQMIATLSEEIVQGQALTVIAWLNLTIHAVADAQEAELAEVLAVLKALGLKELTA